MIRRLLIILSLTTIAACLAIALWAWRDWHSEPLPFEETRSLLVEPGDSLNGIARRLEKQRLIASAFDLKLLARIKGVDAQIKAGEYRLEPGVTLAGLLGQLVKGDIVQYSFTIVEGMNWRELRAKIAATDEFRHVISEMSDAEIMASLGSPGVHPEGQFLPETYKFTRGMTDLDFLGRAHAALHERLEKEWQDRAQDLPLDTPYEALILASIVEKETGVPEERAEIAGVFVRRLQNGMRLQTDPTVIYGMGESYTGDIRFRDLRTDTPYNTYTRGGLPPTPIAMVGADAIHAALHPAEGDTLYFVATGDGGHVFSSTLAEHNRNVRKYQMQRKPLDEDTQ